MIGYGFHVYFTCRYYFPFCFYFLHDKLRLKPSMMCSHFISISVVIQHDRKWNSPLTQVITFTILKIQDKSHRDEDQLDSAAEMRKRQAQYAAEKEEEAMKSQPPPQVIPTTRFTPREMTAPQPMKKPGIEPRVGESFV